MDPNAQRTEAVVVRAGIYTAHVSLPAWHKGAITITAPTSVLCVVTGRTRAELPGASLTVAVCLDAVLDTDLHPHDWAGPRVLPPEASAEGSPPR
ncbi:hypothetical protein ABZ636_36775 [Streptomyces sp. NPDC007251]|uniref:hypothetical protein n=1 Tax=Streptomyces sp. NPDC007251 TaxID=3154483 RepID=UPI0033CCAF0B